MPIVGLRIFLIALFWTDSFLSDRYVVREPTVMNSIRVLGVLPPRSGVNVAVLSQTFWVFLENTMDTVRAAKLFSLPTDQSSSLNFYTHGVITYKLTSSTSTDRQRLQALIRRGVRSIDCATPVFWLNCLSLLMNFYSDELQLIQITYSRASIASWAI